MYTECLPEMHSVGRNKQKTINLYYNQVAYIHKKHVRDVPLHNTPHLTFDVIYEECI